MKSILIAFVSLIAGIAIGILFSGFFSGKQVDIYAEIPTVEEMKADLIKSIRPDEQQAGTVGPVADRYAANLHTTLTECQKKMYLWNEYMYNELKTVLNDAQKASFEKRIREIKTRIGINN